MDWRWLTFGPRRFFPDCTIAMRGYDFREGQGRRFIAFLLTQSKKPGRETGLFGVPLAISQQNTQAA
jgi:hypothetical protein